MKRATNRSVDDCFICKKSIPDSFSESSPRSIQPKRLVKTRKSVTAPSVEWIKCDTCKHWLHTQCCGLSNIEFKKLSGDKQFFKCLVCCLKSLPSNCRTELLQSANRESDSTLYFLIHVSYPVIRIYQNQVVSQLLHMIVYVTPHR